MPNVLTDVTPRVWIGCLACYNAGKLVGEWVDATDAVEITSNDIHNESENIDHDELWCFDHENIPTTGELDPLAAASWGELFEETGESNWLALCAWVTGGAYTADSNNLPSIPDFEERYCGQWDSFRDYADNLADEIGLLDETCDEIARYFDWEAWTRDLEFDYSVCDAPHGGVFVFRSF